MDFSSWNLFGPKTSNTERYRNWADPVSILDRSATKSIKWNPLDAGSLTHDYGNIAKDFTSTETRPISTDNLDGSTSLIA